MENNVNYFNLQLRTSR